MWVSEIPARFNGGGAVRGRGGEERKKGLGFVKGEVRRDDYLLSLKVFTLASRSRGAIMTSMLSLGAAT